MVTRQVHLFNASIRENLLLADLYGDPGDLVRVYRIAQVRAFITGLPDGQDTRVGETGVRLSGRIAIARALLRGCLLLILDGRGEGHDAVTEKNLMYAVLQSLGDCGLLLMSHSATRLEAIDEIVLLDEGRVLDHGRFPDISPGITRYRFDSDGR